MISAYRVMGRTIVGLSLALLCVSTVDAKTLAVGKKVEGDAKAAVQSFVRTHLDAFGVRHAELRFERRIALKRGEVLRFEQVHQGLPVLGRGVSALLRDGRLIVVTGKLASITTLHAGPRVSRATAERALRVRLKGVKVSSARLAIRSQAPTRLVWQLRASTLAPPNSWRALVDAKTGELMHYLSTRVSAEGWAYLPNPEVGELTQVTLQRLEDDTMLDGTYANVQRCAVINMESMECDRLASPMRNESYLWAHPDEPSISDAFAEVHTYYHVDAIHHWLEERFGFKRIREKQQLDVYVNFHFRDEEGEASGMPNAFFGDVTGDGVGELVFGQAGRDFAYDADVIYHEFGHSVVDETSQLEPEFDELGFNMMPMALNEAFADLTSSAFTGDGNVGEYAGGSYGDMSIRDLSGTLMTCPDDLFGESHHDSLIFSRVAWAVRDGVKSKRAFDEVLYTTMVTLHSTADIADALGVLSATAGTIMPGTEGLVEKAMASADLTKGCSRVIPLEVGDQTRGYVMSAAVSPAYGFVPAGMQYRIDVPDDVTELTIKVRAMGRYDPSMGRPYTGAFIRQGETVAFDGPQSLRDFTMTSEQEEITISVDDAEKPLVPGSTYFVLPLNISMQDVAYQIEVLADRAPEPDAAPLEPDAGVFGDDVGASAADAAGGDDGGCAVAHGSGRAPTLLLLFAALFTLCRRRASSSR